MASKQCVVSEGNGSVLVEPSSPQVEPHESGADHVDGLLMMCRDSAGYQQVSVSLLIRTLARTVGHLEARTSSMNEAHRREVHAVASRLMTVAEVNEVVVAA